MIDPRNAIVALFTNGRIAVTDEYGTEYVAVQIREDNMNTTVTNDQMGVFILEPIINEQIVTISIGGKTVMEMATILVNLWVARKKGMKNPEVFMQSVLDTFENAIIDHQFNLDATTTNMTINNISTLPSESPELMRKAIMLTAWGYKIRP